MRIESVTPASSPDDPVHTGSWSQGAQIGVVVGMAVLIIVLVVVVYIKRLHLYCCGRTEWTGYKAEAYELESLKGYYQNSDHKDFKDIV